MAWTSPRTTKLLHQVGNFQRLLNIGVVAHEPAGFGGEPAAATFALGGLSDGLASGFGARDSSASGDFVERAETIGAES
jgi:hypothetical protein